MKIRAFVIVVWDATQGEGFRARARDFRGASVLVVQNSIDAFWAQAVRICREAVADEDACISR